MSTERENFEAWFQEHYHSRLSRNMPDKSYNDPTAHSMWGAWQARSEIASSPAGDVGALRRVVHELRTYNPAADAYKGVHIHKGWALKIEEALAAAPAAPAYTQSTLEEHAAALKAGDLMALAEEAGGNRTAENVVEMTREDLARIGTDFVRAAAPVAEPVIEWIDEWEAKHTMSPSRAAKELKNLFDRWPNGVDEMEASIDGYRRMMVNRIDAGDSARLNWLSLNQGCNLISDDGGQWALSTSGIQPVPEGGRFTETVAINSWVDPEEWKPSVRAAIDFVMDRDDSDTPTPGMQS
jgi:hypothetical protein